MNEKIREVLKGFREFDGVYKQELVDEAIELKGEIIPYLIEVLENVRAEPNRYIEDPDRWDHIYAVMLLGHFREPRAHNVMVDIFSLPDRLANDVFGDIVTEDLPAILMRTCGGSLDQIKSLALNRKADDFCRASALHAMAYSVIEGITTREVILSFYETLFTGHEAEKHSDFWGLLACIVYELYPEEVMETINRAYEDGLIHPEMIGHNDFKKALARGKEECLADLKRNYERSSLDDVHKSMSWWACFDGNDTDPLPPYIPPPEPIYIIEEDTKKKEKAKKKKRKMEKASKRKNRR